MPVTDLDLVNQALLILGEDTVAALTDEPVGVTCDALYDTHTNFWLATYPWSFCKAKVKLVVTTAPLTVWTYAHTLPANRLTGSWAVYNTDSVGASPIRDYDIQGQTLLSNEPEIWVDYTARPDEDNWPAYFQGFVVYALASVFANPITQDSGLAQEMRGIAFGSPADNGRGGMFGMAMATDSQLKPSSVIVDSPIIEARFS